MPDGATHTAGPAASHQDLSYRDVMGKLEGYHNCYNFLQAPDLRRPAVQATRSVLECPSETHPRLPSILLRWLLELG